MNTNKTSACLMPSKVPSPVNLKNRFSSLMVTEESGVTENESQVQTPNNYHQCIKIQNTKSKSRAEKSKSYIMRPTIAIIENYNNVQI